MPKDIIQSRLGAIRLEEEAIGFVRERVRQKIGPYDCPKDKKPDDCLYVDRLLVDMETSFRDHYIDAIEEPYLFSELKRIAGEDGVVSRDEAREYQAAHAMNVPGPETPTLLPDVKQYEAVIKHMKTVEEHLAALIGWLENLERDLRPAEESRLNILSAENMLGLSTWLDPDFAPFSAMELKGVQNFLSWLYRMQAGFHVFQSQLEQGRHRFNSKVVQEFLAGPLATYGHLGSHFQGEEENESEDDKYYRLLHFSRGMVQKALGCGADRLAISLAETYVDSIGEKIEESLNALLPPAVIRSLDASTHMVNSFLSLDNLAVAAFSGGLGLALSGTAKGALLFAKLHSLPAWVRYTLPGLQPFSFKAGGSFSSSLTTGITNTAYEIGRLGAYHTLAHRVGNDKFASGLSGALMVVEGSVEIFTSTVPGKISRELLTRPGPLVENFLDGIQPPRADLKKWGKVFAIGADPHSLRPATDADPDILANGLLHRQQARTMELKLAGKAEAVIGKIQTAMEELRKLMDKNPDVLKDDWWNEALRTAELGNPQQTLHALNRLLEEAKQEVRAVRIAASLPAHSGPRSNPLDNRGGRRQAGGGGTNRKGDSNGSETIEDIPAATPAPQSALTLLEEVVSTPPTIIHGSLVAKLTQDRVTLSKRAGKKLREFYDRQPALRATLWRRFKELVQDEVGDWKKIHGDRGILRGRIGDFRIMVQRKGDRFIILDIVERSNLTRPRQRF